MKKALIIIIMLFIVSSCSSVSPETPEQKKERMLYSSLGQLAVETKSFKCSALLNIKQITPFHMLTKDGKLYNINFSGIYSDTNENCGINTQFKDKTVKAILPTAFLSKFQNLPVYDVFYYDDKMSYVDDRDRLVESIYQSYYLKFADKGVFKYTTYLVDMTTITTTGSGLFYVSYIEDNKVLSTSNGKYSSPYEIKVFDLTEGETIQKLTPFGLITSKSVYLFRIKANEEQCQKYVDIKCQIGFAYSESGSKIINEYSPIILYFDGYYIVTKDGRLFKLIHE